MEILIFGLSVFSVSFFIAYINASYHLKKTTAMLTETMLLYMVSSENDSDLNNKNSSEEIHKENFIKFLSDSRDWAFDYIDKSQKQIKEFIEVADKEFAFFDSFGILTEEYPNYKAMKIISEEYKKLKDLLPKENDDRR